MAKSKTKEQISRGQAHAKATAATDEKARPKGKAAAKAGSKNKLDSAATAKPAATGSQAKSPAKPVSTDIRRGYMKSLLGDYLGQHRGGTAIKPKK